MADFADNLRARLKTDRFLAHSALFAHRHEYPFAPFHRDLIEDFWRSEEGWVDLGFRECGKTTLVEEAIAFAACEGGFRNCLIVGAKESLAAELLLNVKVELEQNEQLLSLYGEMRGEVWTSTKITLRDGHCIQAIGRGQSLRGTKHLDWRPDLVVVNDFEDDEDLLTPDGRRATLRWFLRVLLPACDRARRRFRIYDTLRDAESVPMMLIKQGWGHRLIPISYLDEDGEERSSWPQHPTLSMDWIRRERQTYFSFSSGDIWEREFMMNAATQADRVFTDDMIRIEHVARTWHAVYAMIDPARSKGKNSADTGWSVWSWIGPKLVVWEAGAAQLMPDEVIDLAFRLERTFQPVELGIEQDGLNEWLATLVRQRAAREMVTIPYRGINAPRGKLDFIRGLQPLFAGGQCVWVRDFPELRQQMLAFPTGRIDAPNALAYAQGLRPGRLVYDGWNPNHHVTVEEPHFQRPLYLAVNATQVLVTAALMQLVDSRIVVLADWISEGEPGETLEHVMREASMAAGRGLVLVAASQHFEQYKNVGLVQAARSLGLEVRQAGRIEPGRELIRKELGRVDASGPLFRVAPAAAWTLRALAGGYSRPMVLGQLSGDIAQNRYKVLMEGIEALAGLFAWGIEDEDAVPRNFAYDAQGRRYLSAMPYRETTRARH